jgi:hypothetical protein
MGSVQELEAKMAIERKMLMQALSDYLSQAGVKAELQQEPATDYMGMSVLESVVRLKEQNVDRIRLVGIGGGCGVPGNIMRFQYEIGLDKELSAEQMSNMSAITRVIKDGKAVNLFRGKVDGIKWDGQRLAEILNQDQAITDDLMKCVKSWAYLEFQIEAVSPRDVYITGPRFDNPGTIAELYRSNLKEEIQCCIFGYTMVAKIAKHIKDVSISI